jgi:putative ABC transport system permease protein
MGDTPDIRKVQRFNIDSGRFLNWLDIGDRRKVTVIGTRVRDVLFEDGADPIGEYVRINGVFFRIVGVFSSVRTGKEVTRDVETLYVPLSTFQQVFNYGNEVGWYAITSREDVPASVAEAGVISLLKRRHRVAPDDRRAFGSWNTEEEYQELQGLFLGIGTLIWIVGIGTLSAGVIGVSNIMLVIVKERTKEIGIRRAVGAGPLSIIGQIVLESIILTAVAGYFGLFAAVSVVELVAFVMEQSGANPQMFAPPSVGIGSAVWALIILVAAGALAGLIPARRAITINTVEALRS